MSLSGSPMGTATMLDFTGRPRISPQTEQYPMNRVNEAVERLEDGKARYWTISGADYEPFSTLPMGGTT